MTAKLIVSVKEVNGIAQVVYYCKERRRIYRKSFADTVGEGYAAGLRPAAPLPGGREGCTPTCRTNTVTNMKVWDITIELDNNKHCNVIIEVIASTENKARVNAEIKARKKYNTNFVKSVNVKYLGIYKES